MQKIIIANWKMNGTLAEARERAKSIVDAAPEGVEIVICPPFVHLATVLEVVAGSSVKLGAQNCHFAEGGAYTGSVSAKMLAEAGCKYVILGHSERRRSYAESDSIVRDKGRCALAVGLTPIVCVGETLTEREAGEAVSVVERQLAGSLPEGKAIIAYEPIWAIGTGKTATVEDVSAMHAAIKKRHNRTPVVYGGSVKANNAKELIAIPEVDGFLVGGASLVAAEFLQICEAGSAVFSG